MNIRELIKKLQDSPGMIFDIFDTRSGNRIEANRSFESLEDPEGFFTAMLERFEEIQVQPKEPRGNSSRNPRAVMIVKKENDFLPNDYRTPQTELPPMTPRHMHMGMGLNGFAGLNGAEVLNSMIDAKSLRTENKLLQDNLDAAKKLNSSLETQLKEAKLKNSELEVQNKTLETLKNLEKKQAILEHESGLSKFLGKVEPAQVIPMLAMFAPKNTPPTAQNTGLAGVENLSNQKKGIIQLVSEDFFQDPHAALLLKIAEHLATQDGFYEQLNTVLFGTPQPTEQPIEQTTENDAENLTVVS